MKKTFTIFLVLSLCSVLRAFASDISALNASVESIAKSIDARWGIYMKNLETGEEITINADSQMETMSVIKIPIMVEAFRQIKEGKIHFDERMEGDRQDGASTLVDAGVGRLGHTVSLGDSVSH